MREPDFDPFVSMLDDVAALLNHGKPLTAGYKSMCFRAVAKHPLDVVRNGFDAHVKDPQRGRFMPVPADILAQIGGSACADGRPGPEEAWATALRASDESATVVWTDEASRAWAIALPVLKNGDDIGARMAFKEAYVRLVEEARRARRQPVWTASLGFDPAMRDEALRDAQAAGLLSGPEVLALPSPAESFAALVSSPAIPDETREKLLALREMFARRIDGPNASDVERQRLAELKAETERKATEYMAAASHAGASA